MEKKEKSHLLVVQHLLLQLLRQLAALVDLVVLTMIQKHKQ
jgi:hypothetical protein